MPIKYTISIETEDPFLNDSQKSLIEWTNHLTDELQKRDKTLTQRAAIEALCLLFNNLNYAISAPDNREVDRYIEMAKSQYKEEIHDY